MRIGIVLLVAVTVVLAAEAAEIVVGGDTGWRPTTPTFYSTWVSGQTFTVGDILVFNFPTGGQDVAGVTKENYDNCISDNPNFLNSTTPFSFPLNSAADFYFICTVPGHCAAGQKLAVTNVQQPSSSTPPPPSTPNTPPVSGDQPPPPATPDTPPVSGDQPPPASPDTPPVSGDHPPPDSPPVTGDQPPSAVDPPPQNSGSATLGSVFAVAFASVAAALIIF